MISRNITIQSLLDFGDPALTYFTRRNLLGMDPGDISDLWDLPDVGKIIGKQHPDGFWPYPKRSKNAHPSENYHILQTFRTLGFLIEMYGLDRSNSAISKAADYLLGQQSEEGDIRGIFGTQYAPHYTAGILELLLKAGYQDDSRIEKIFMWFEETRQKDGGWAWPLRTSNTRYQDAIELDHPVESDLTKPFSHALTMFVIRAYAAHTDYRNSTVAEQAGILLKGRFFQADKYTDRKAVGYWFKFQYPFWWGNLLTALDSLSIIGFPADDTDIQTGIAWFYENQQTNGFWPTGYGQGNNSDLNQAWVALAVSKMLLRFSKEEIPPNFHGEFPEKLGKSHPSD